MIDRLKAEAEQAALEDARARAAYRSALSSRGDVAVAEAVAIAAADKAAAARKAYRVAAEAASVRSFITVT